METYKTKIRHFFNFLSFFLFTIIKKYKKYYFKSPSQFQYTVKHKYLCPTITSKLQLNSYAMGFRRLPGTKLDLGKLIKNKSVEEYPFSSFHFSARKNRNQLVPSGVRGTCMSRVPVCAHACMPRPEQASSSSALSPLNALSWGGACPHIQDQAGLPVSSQDLLCAPSTSGLYACSHTMLFYMGARDSNSSPYT